MVRLLDASPLVARATARYDPEGAVYVAVEQACVLWIVAIMILTIAALFVRAPALVGAGFVIAIILLMWTIVRGVSAGRAARRWRAGQSSGDDPRATSE